MADDELQQIAEENRQGIITEIRDNLEIIGQACYDATVIMATFPSLGFLYDASLESMGYIIRGLVASTWAQLMATGLVAAIRVIKEEKEGGGFGQGIQNPGRHIKAIV